MRLWEWKVKIAEAKIKLQIEAYKAKVARIKEANNDR